MILLRLYYVFFPVEEGHVLNSQHQLEEKSLQIKAISRNRHILREKVFHVFISILL